MPDIIRVTATMLGRETTVPNRRAPIHVRTVVRASTCNASATSVTWVKIVGNGTAQKTATDTVFATTVSAHVCPAGVEWRAMSASVPRTIR